MQISDRPSQFDHINGSPETFSAFRKPIQRTANRSMAQSRSNTNRGTHSFGLLLLLLFLHSSQAAAMLNGHEQNNNNELTATGLTDQVVDQLAESDLYNNNKRAWQSLQSSWGKRSAPNDPSGFEMDDSIYMTGHFVPLVITDGTNTIDWNTFERWASGNQDQLQQHQQQQQQQQQQQAQLLQSPQSIEDSEELGADNAMEKRAWKNMNVAWGKRRQAQGWNKFRGAWGKREPTWNNLKGMWGKRDQWQKLHAGWGKRSLAGN